MWRRSINGRLALSGAAARMRGFALIIVLWFLVLIGAVGIVLILHARSETAIAHNILTALVRSTNKTSYA